MKSNLVTLFAFIIFCTLTACSKNDKVTYKIGQSLAGGVVAYVDSTGQHGLIAANTDLVGTSIWGCQNTLIGTSRNYGQGLMNTQKIVSGCSDVNSAARKCSDLIIDGKDDWFLPTFDELVLLFNNLHKKGLGGFKPSIYASSSEANNDPVWGPSVNMIRMDFTGSSAGEQYTPKGGLYNVRPCRYF